MTTTPKAPPKTEQVLSCYSLTTTVPLTASQLSFSAGTTAIQNSAVTTAKLANDAVTAAKIDPNDYDIWTDTYLSRATFTGTLTLPTFAASIPGLNTTSYYQWGKRKKTGAVTMYEATPTAITWSSDGTDQYVSAANYTRLTNNTSKTIRVRIVYDIASTVQWIYTTHQLWSYIRVNGDSTVSNRRGQAHCLWQKTASWTGFTSGYHKLQGNGIVTLTPGSYAEVVFDCDLDNDDETTENVDICGGSNDLYSHCTVDIVTINA
jgi:hypothetical protein